MWNRTHDTCKKTKKSSNIIGSKINIEHGRLLVGNIMVIDSYDGAVHSSSNTKECGIVSYNF